MSSGPSRIIRSVEPTTSMNKQVTTRRSLWASIPSSVGRTRWRRGDVAAVEQLALANRLREYDYCGRRRVAGARPANPMDTDGQDDGVGRVLRDWIADPASGVRAARTRLLPDH